MLQECEESGNGIKKRENIGMKDAEKKKQKNEEY